MIAKINIANENKNFVKITKTHNNLLDEISRELGIVKECVNKLESNGITRDA